MTRLDETLILAKDLYKYAIVNEDKFVEDKALQLITNITLISKISIKDKKNIDFDNEIARVKRKVPKWLMNPTKYNSKILKAYMTLSANNENPINISELEKYYIEIDDKTFLSNYNQMKNISKKNHAKVFDEHNKLVSLWKPVDEFIVELYFENNFRIWAKNKGKMSQEYVIENYIKALNTYIPNNLEAYNIEPYYNNLFSCKDINFLERIRSKYLKDGEWNNIEHNSNLPSSIKKYIDFLKDVNMDKK